MCEWNAVPVPIRQGLKLTEADGMYRGVCVPRETSTQPSVPSLAACLASVAARIPKVFCLAGAHCDYVLCPNAHFSSLTTILSTLTTSADQVLFSNSSCICCEAAVVLFDDGMSWWWSGGWLLLSSLELCDVHVRA